MKETTWHYNIIKHTTKAGIPYYQIHEVYVDSEAGKEDKFSFTDAIAPVGDTRHDLIKVLEMILKDAKRHRTVVIKGKKLVVEYEKEDNA